MPSDIAGTAPSSLAHIVGQRAVVEQIKVAVDAAQIDGKPIDHCLLTGPPGVGKSSLARVVSLEMASTLHEVLGQSLRRSADLNSLLLQAADRDIVHIDECHELPRPTQTALLMALDQCKIFPGGRDAGLTPIRLAAFTLLMSTTDEDRLVQPLRDRMKVVLRFQFYSEPELATVLARRVKATGWDVVETVFPEIARRSRGTPRIALRLLTAAHRVARADGQQTVTMDHLERACSLENLDGMGLGSTEQEYLRLVGNGVGRLNVLASSLGVSAQTVAKLVEPFLIRAGLLVKDDSGRRELTAEGRSHLSSLRRKDA